MSAFEPSDSQPSDSEEDVAMLFRIAGTAPELPDHEVAPIRAAAWQAWQRRRQQQRRRRLVAGFAAAASVALVMAGVGWLRGGAITPPGVVATLAHTTGAVTIQLPEGAVGDGLVPGALVRTASGAAVALRLGDGTSVRLAGSSQLEIAAARRLRLVGGAAYIDTGVGPSQAVTLETAYGTVVDVGTQFEVRLLEDPGLRVRVREGEVRIEGTSQAHRVTAGQQLVLRGSETERSRIAADDPSWGWASDAAPPLDVAGRRVPELYDWASRELGTQWQSPRPRAELEKIIIHGTIEGLTPGEAMEQVATSSGLSLRREGSVVIVE